MVNLPVRYMNKVLLKGRLGKNPEIRKMPSGDSVCNFSLATKSGSHVEWHRVVAYGARADYVNAAFGVGDVVYLEAEIKTREFTTAEDKANGRQPRKVTELIVEEAHLVRKRGNNSENEESSPGDSEEGEPILNNHSTEFQNGNSDLPNYI